MKGTVKDMAWAFLLLIVVLIFFCITSCKTYNETQHTSSYKEIYHDSIVYLKGEAIRSNMDSMQLARILFHLRLHKNDTVVMKSYSGNLQMKYYLDQFGQLQSSCEEKDKTINGLIKTIQKWDSTNQSKVQYVVKHEMVWWGWIVLTLSCSLSVILLVKQIFKI